MIFFSLLIYDAPLMDPIPTTDIVLDITVRFIYLSTLVYLDYLWYKIWPNPELDKYLPKLIQNNFSHLEIILWSWWLLLSPIFYIIINTLVFTNTPIGLRPKLTWFTLVLITTYLLWLSKALQTAHTTFKGNKQSTQMLLLYTIYLVLRTLLVLLQAFLCIIILITVIIYACLYPQVSFVIIHCCYTLFSPILKFSVIFIKFRLLIFVIDKFLDRYWSVYGPWLKATWYELRHERLGLFSKKFHSWFFETYNYITVGFYKNYLDKIRLEKIADYIHERNLRYWALHDPDPYYIIYWGNRLRGFRMRMVRKKNKLYKFMKKYYPFLLIDTIIHLLINPYRGSMEDVKLCINLIKFRIYNVNTVRYYFMDYIFYKVIDHLDPIKLPSCYKNRVNWKYRLSNILLIDLINFLTRYYWQNLKPFLEFSYFIYVLEKPYNLELGIRRYVQSLIKGPWYLLHRVRVFLKLSLEDLWFWYCNM